MVDRWLAECLSAVAMALAAAPLAAQTARQMAADRGCHNCHGEPGRSNVRTFAQLAAAYAPLRSQPDAQQKALERMHHGSMFSHIAAHERLSEEDAAALVRWLFEGG